jgi:hypothetical protein
MNYEIDNINTYYKTINSTIDKPIINEFCKNNYLKNLLNLSIKNNLPVVSKKNKRWIIKDKDDILSQCENKKKKEIRKALLQLSRLTKDCSKNSIMEIKKVNNELEDKIINIDMMMEHISSTEDEYIECYSN